MGDDLNGERVLLDVSLGQRERYEDWLEMGRGLVRRGLWAPTLVVADGAPGLIRAIEELWPASDRQRCTCHRMGGPHVRWCGRGRGDPVPYPIDKPSHLGPVE